MSFETSSSHDESTGRLRKKLHPDPIRAPPRLTTSTKATQTHSSKLLGYGPHRSYRHLHHQQHGIIGTFHVRLLEGRNLRRRHWSALSLGPVKHLGLSRAHGEVSSFGTLRLAFWKNRDGECERDCLEDNIMEIDGYNMMKQTTRLSKPISLDTQASASAASPLTTTYAGDSTPLTPFDQHGSLRSSTEMGMSQSLKQSTQQQHQKRGQDEPQPQHRTTTPRIANLASPPRHSKTASRSTDPFASQSSKSLHNNTLNPRSISPHHYAKEVFKSSTVPNDCNPVWGDNTNNDNNDINHGNNSNISSFHIPLHKDDLLPTLKTDGARISLEIRLDEEMAPTESLLVDGALTSAVNVASVATSVVGMGRQTKNVSNFGREMLGLSSDRLIGSAFVDLMPLLVGLWEEDWEGGVSTSSSSRREDEEEREEDANLDAFGKITSSARMRVERMGMLDVWVPLNHPSDAMNTSVEDKDKTAAGKVHLLITYEPNGLTPKRDDVVALESFARRPFDLNSDNGAGSSKHNTNSSSNAGSVIHPILPTLSPFLVIDMKGFYLLLEYATSRTVTSVDRLGNIKSSRWERTHRVRIHRNSVFVIERRTLLDVAGNIARLPGDIVLSTSVGQEIAEASAPLVAGALELVSPAWQGAKLLMGAGSLGVKASLAGAKAASVAVVSVSQQKAMERREGVCADEEEESYSGVYRYG